MVETQRWWWFPLLSEIERELSDDPENTQTRSMWSLLNFCLTYSCGVADVLLRFLDTSSSHVETSTQASGLKHLSQVTQVKLLSDYLLTGHIDSIGGLDTEARQHAQCWDKNTVLLLTREARSQPLTVETSNLIIILLKLQKQGWMTKRLWEDRVQA